MSLLNDQTQVQAIISIESFAMPSHSNTTQISLLDSTRLSSLLQEALTWDESVSSILLSASNGSLLAYAFRDKTPSVKAMRTRSTTVTTAYAVAGQSTLVFEAQRTGALTVISSVADEVLLSVTGPEPSGSDPYEKTVHEALDKVESNNTQGQEAEPEDPELSHLRDNVQAVNEELASILRPGLADIKWPDDI